MQVQFTQQEIDRFWSKVDKSGECWLWTRATTRGYGNFSVGPNGKQRHYRAHRVAYMLCKGPIPDGAFVLHDCPGGDNPTCVNPSHLWLGDAYVNYHDAERKGRLLRGDRHPSRARPETRPRGEAHWGAKLTEDIVREIRARYDAGSDTQVALHIEFGMSRTQIANIVHRRHWTHVA